MHIVPQAAYIPVFAAFVVFEDAAALQALLSSEAVPAGLPAVLKAAVVFEAVFASEAVMVSRQMVQPLIVYFVFEP